MTKKSQSKSLGLLVIDYKSLVSSKGQALIEVIIAITLGSIFLVTGVFALSSLLFSNLTNRNLQTAVDLASGLMDNVRAEADANWLNIYALTKASSTHYYINTVTSPFATSSGDEVVSVGGIAFSRYFYVDNVNRDVNGNATSAAGSVEDPSTQQITAVVTWPGTTSGVSLSEYFTRYHNNVFVQTDWFLGSGQELFATTSDGTIVNNGFASSSNVSTSIAGQISLTGVSGELTSSVFDTLVVGGAAINSVMWEGMQPAGTTVKFQVGSSNSSAGPWTYAGSDGTSATYYTPTGFDTPIKLTRAYNNNKRYLRYKLVLSAPSIPSSLLVSGVVMNWSP